MHIAVDGSVLPCNIAGRSPGFHSVKTHSLAAARNSSGLRRLRRAMLEGRPSSVCDKCYEQEENGFFSQRECANEDFAHHERFIDLTAADGSLSDIPIAYLDIRFSNVCNLVCRTCEPKFSTAWYRYASADERPTGAMNARDDAASLLREIEPILDDVEQIYFAGGEPTLMPEHYQLLEILLARGREDVRLTYSTNFSTLRYKHWDLLALWRQFRHVNVGASLDADGRRGDYLRKGQHWTDVIENRRRQLVECPHVTFNITTTFSNMNCLHSPDLHESWVEKGLIGAGEVHIIILQTPAYFRLTTLPNPLKEQVRERYLAHIDYLGAHPGCETAMRGYRAAITYMSSEDSRDLLATFRRVVSEQDRLRNESFADAFPELSSLLNAEMDFA